MAWYGHRDFFILHRLIVPDLVVHRVLKRFLAGQRDFSSAQEAFPTLARAIDAAALRASRAETERTRLLITRALDYFDPASEHGGDLARAFAAARDCPGSPSAAPAGLAADRDSLLARSV